MLKSGEILVANFDNQEEAQATMNYYVKEGNVASQHYTFFEIPVIEQAQEFHDSLRTKDNIAVKITPKQELKDIPEKAPIEVAPAEPVEEVKP